MDSKCKQNTKPVKPTCRWKIIRRKRAKQRRLKRKRLKRLINKRQRNITSDQTFTNNSHISTLGTSTMNTIPLPLELMRLPGSEWFMENYKFCQRWQEKHQNAVYNSRLAGLEYENAMLHKQMQQLREENQILKNRSTQLPCTSSNLPFYHKTYYPEFKPDVQQYSHTVLNEEYYSQGDVIRVEDGEIEDNNYKTEGDDENYNIVDENYLIDDKNNEADDDEDCDDDDEFLKFLESTRRHREELKKFREEQSKKESEEFVDTKWFSPVQTDAERRVIMERLYGDDSAMIQGMETAVQLTFERNCDRNRPIMWPNIPLRKPYYNIVSS